MLTQMSKSPKLTAHMIKHRIEHNPNAAPVTGFNHLLKGGVIAEAGIHMVGVKDVIPMRTGGKHRPQQQYVDPQTLQMVQPAVHFRQMMKAP